MGSVILTLEETILKSSANIHLRMDFRATICFSLFIAIIIIGCSSPVGGKYLLVDTVDKPAGGSEADYDFDPKIAETDYCGEMCDILMDRAKQRTPSPDLW